MAVFRYFRFLLFPFALLYSAGVGLRNFMYNAGLMKSVEFDFPIISVGNLSYGGTGKTPHIEYLIRLLSAQYAVATLSRGYKRKTYGYVLANVSHSAKDIGDEPSQLKKKYPRVAVAVAESRALAVPQLLTDAPQTDVILLDDAFQHRSIMPGMSVLLTTYENLFTRDYILPVGTLREPKSGKKRADFIIVTKCPTSISLSERQRIVQEIEPSRNQAVLFSYLQYEQPYNVAKPADRLAFLKDMDVFLFCGIANPQPIIDHVKPQVRNLYVKAFDDHHFFDRFDIEQLSAAFNNIEHTNKVMLTTEKDITRLFALKDMLIQLKLPIYVLPVQAELFREDKQLFDSEVMGYLHRLRPPKNADQPVPAP